MSRWFLLAMALVCAHPLVAGQVETTPASSHGEPATGGVADALGRATPWLGGDAGKYQLHSARDIVIDTRRRTLMVFAVPAKHRKVVAMLQRIFADPSEHPATPPSLAPKIPPKPAGPMSSYKYQGEKISTIIRDLAAEANMNLVIRGPEPAQTCDCIFKDVPTKDLLKLLLDIYNFNYQMSPNGETLVIFCGPTHRVMESYNVPAKVSVPLEEIAQALQSTILDVDEPCGPPVEERGVSSTGTGDAVSVEVPSASVTGTGDGAPAAPPSPAMPDANTGGAIEVMPSPAELPASPGASPAPTTTTGTGNGGPPPTGTGNGGPPSAASVAPPASPAPGAK